MGDKAIFITGASSDVGIELVRGIHRDYSHIYLHYNHMNDDLDRLVTDIATSADVRLLQADFNDESDTDRMVEELIELEAPPSSIVHIAAPKVGVKHFHKSSWEDFDSGWDVSVRSIVKVLRGLIRGMSGDKYGRIVFLLTSYVNGNPPKYLSSYVTYKYALLGLMKSLSQEYISKGITVNAISPNMMETKFLSELPDKIIEQNILSSPIGRNIRIDEIIPVIRMLLSDEASSITGENIAITGGM